MFKPVELNTMKSTWNTVALIIHMPSCNEITKAKLCYVGAIIYENIAK